MASGRLIAMPSASAAADSRTCWASSGGTRPSAATRAFIVPSRAAVRPDRAAPRPAPARSRRLRRAAAVRGWHPRRACLPA
ncbi:hypothetical protein WR25_23501 [Diploscapter pachys]|uniref:Uncharacterized protein n=1 Tax=Diploscapter pachys TaxID=2018661 RepID=A0A2A2M5Q8_9BILA|nr:hypothetical protein WR25_23501 [Diploscapter pachys]